MPPHYQICIGKFLRPYNDDLPENLDKNTAQECKKSTSGLRASLKNAFAPWALARQPEVIPFFF